jgi:hypothetical protein
MSQVCRFAVEPLGTSTIKLGGSGKG